MKEEKKYPCEQCYFGIYMTVQRKWWCDLYDMYAPQVARNISEPSKHRKVEKNDWCQEWEDRNETDRRT